MSSNKGKWACKGELTRLQGNRKQRIPFGKSSVKVESITINAWITPEPGEYQDAVWDFSSFYSFKQLK
jgi:hypothetical protein